ncbi:MAG: phosphoribosylformylglycinamidine cyclo-ligase [Candidatus Bathyarchaeota archaeon]|nr:MAG: phosphoribosylformylglycinamidine cyclo-ligase [Candidatus Bathyarchaeota archaeon]
MSKEFTYAEAGVDRELRARSKAALQTLKQTYKLGRYGSIIQLPYGNIFPASSGYLDFVIEGIGTKVLLAQLADKYDTIGIDGVAMAVNDVIRSGAKPLALVDNIHAKVSNPYLIGEWMKGIVRGAQDAECIVPSGEIGDVAEIIQGVTGGKGFDMIFACIGDLPKDDIIFGTNIESGDVVIGLRSSGIHSNGISLARKVLFKRWGGWYEPYDIPNTFERELITEVLEPTRIYVKPILKAAKEHKLKGLVHITGDAYLKFDRLMRFSKGIGFEFNNFKPQPIFDLIQETARKTRGAISNDEMLRTFNMGWGFAVVVGKNERDDLISCFKDNGAEADQIGKVTNTGRIVALYNGTKIQLDKRI